MATSDLLRSRTARWLVPVAVVATITAGVGLTSAVANADPSLPSRTAAELLVSIAEAKGQPFSGTVEQNADLGIPALPGASSTSLSWQSLITGSHTARVWVASPSQVRLSLVGDMAESDVVRNGRDVWVWSSKENTVSHATLPAHPASEPDATDATPPVDPLTAATRALAAIDPTTAVTVSGTSRVAGRPVYELVLAPRDDASLVGQVRLAIDSETSMPLRVQVFARGASDPAFETAFSSITFATPDSSVFDFTPPAGATVTEAALPLGSMTKSSGTGADAGTDQPRPTVVGTGWTAVAVIPGAAAALAQAENSSDITSSTSGALLQATTPVSGSYGSGRLLETALVTVLLLDDGRMFVGAVTPERLEQVAASTPR